MKIGRSFDELRAAQVRENTDMNIAFDQNLNGGRLVLVVYFVVISLLFMVLKAFSRSVRDSDR